MDRLRVGSDHDVSSLTDSVLWRAGESRLIGVDGPGGSGKSTFARALEAAGSSREVVENDDFYRPSDDPDRDAPTHGAAFDLGRLAHQVLAPHHDHGHARYQRYDWDDDVLREWVDVRARTVIVEGVYSLHPTIRHFYDVRVVVLAPAEVRLARGLARDGEGARDQWINEWMPAEDAYFSQFAPMEVADLVLDGAGSGDGLSFTIAGGKWTELSPSQ